jgi:hypothetical protein
MVGTASGSTAALEGAIKRDQLDLNDWATCVSAKTTKGQAEIQKFSGDISAAKERIARIEASQPSSQTIASGSTTATNAKNPSQLNAHGAGGPGGLVDVWA